MCNFCTLATSVRRYRGEGGSRYEVFILIPVSPTYARHAADLFLHNPCITLIQSWIDGTVLLLHLLSVRAVQRPNARFAM
jgi:hypothetical protein